jgi:NADH dehydrogenase
MSETTSLRAPAAGKLAARPRVVIVGAGFAGLTAAIKLGGAPVDVTVVDRHNHHVFQPLLYQVATAELGPDQIASPIRMVLRAHQNIQVLLGEVTGVDLANRAVDVGTRQIGFDYLVLATGATHAYFGHDEWAAFAPGLKSLEDAFEFRRRILLALETAEQTSDPAERERLLTFVVVGGGPTGVELTGAIAELAQRTISTEFRNIRTAHVRVVLAEAGDRILPTFDAGLSAYAQRALERRGVQVRLGQAVTRCDAEGVELGKDALGARSVFWAAGVKASPVAGWIGATGDRAGRVAVDPDLSLLGAPNIFVIGDVAHVVDSTGRTAPGVAPAAKQQGEYVAGLIRREAGGRGRGPEFRYRDFGSLATIGRAAAVVQIGPLRLAGPLAWLFWCIAHIYFLIGFRNRLAVMLDWAWAYLTSDRRSRLITGQGLSAGGAVDTAGRVPKPD